MTSIGKSLALGFIALGLNVPQTAAHPYSDSKGFPMNAQSRDERAIVEVIENIARGADLHQWPSVRASFARQVTLDYGTPEVLAPGQIIDRWEPLLEGFDATQHRLTNTTVDLAGARATAYSTFVATHVLRGAPGGDIWTLEGRYEHDLERAGDGWRVTRLKMIPGQATGNLTLIEEAKRRAAQLDLPTDRAVVQAFFERLEAFDIRGVADLFGEQGRQVMPFSPDGFPDELVGSEAVFNQYKRIPDNYTSMRFPGLEIRELVNPGEFFVTYHGEIALKQGGRYDNTYAALFRVSDRKIVELVEYFDPIILQRAFGESLQSNVNVDR